MGGYDVLPYSIDVVAENLDVPWAMAIDDKGKIYFTERNGSIRVIDNGELLLEPLITFESPFVSRGEGGLMGIDLDPNFEDNGYIYVMYSYEDDNRVFNRVVRLKVEDNKAYLDRILINRIPGGLIHNGGRVKVGPDKKLYITTGDAGYPTLAQNLNSLAGKILRIELDGSIPKDNPFYKSPIYSLGHRNPQGLAWSHDNYRLYASEHGNRGHDELNLIKAGENYGWPIVQGYEIMSELIIQSPMIHSGNETWAPSGIVCISQGPWKGRLLGTTLRGQKLLVVLFNEDGTKVETVQSWLDLQYGRLRDVIVAKDGSIYIATNNRDGRGNPSASDDKIIRLNPLTQV